jgi:hypothetical protein
MTKKTNDLRDEIIDYLKKNERPLAWLSRKTNIKYGGLYGIFVQKTTKLSDKHLIKINKVLDTHFINNQNF